MVPKARTYITFPFAYSALCQTWTISSLALITLFSVSKWVFMAILRSSFIQLVGCEGSESVLQAQWVLVSKFREEGMKPVSSLILRRGVQPILFHQQSPSYVCSIITPQRRRGVPFPLLCISLPSACSSKAGSNLGLRFPTVEGNSTASKAQ